MVGDADQVRRTDDLLGREARFADGDAIRARNLARFRLGLAMLAAKDPSDERLYRLSSLDASALRCVLYDPVLRNAFEDEMTRLEAGLEPSGILAHVVGVADVEEAPTCGPCERLVAPSLRPWPDRAPTWLMGEIDHARGEPYLRERLAALCRGTLDDVGSVDQVPATPEMCAALRAGADLLHELLPVAGTGVLPHIALIGFATDDSSGEKLYSVAGGDPLPSAIFMAPEQLENPWTTAETLLHEGLHLKLFDIIRSGSLVADPELEVSIPWRTNRWTLVRVLFALHVYVHLVLFRAAAVTASDTVVTRYGPPPDTEIMDAPSPGSPAAAEGTYQTSLDRARYLAEQAESLYRQHLTGDGRRFVRWLIDTITTLVPGIRNGRNASPPPRDVEDGTALSTAGRFNRREPALNVVVPEVNELVVMTLAEPRVRWLNSQAWLVYALCDGSPLPAIEAAYADAIGGEVSQEGVAATVRRGVLQLSATGLVSADDGA